jgi:protein-S-isoprenylcysteine O-methyltransferase Ste14
MENLHYILAHPISWPWLCFWAYWFVAALFAKRIARRQATSTTLLYVVFVLPAFFLVFDPNWGVGWLGRYFLPDSRSKFASGIAITCIGLAFAIWARIFLGSNWSGSVAVKEQHTLTRTGPYRWVRHPIYTGMLVGAAGTAVSVGEWRGVCGVVLMTLGFYIKARQEEQLMMQTFGAQYEEYKRATGMLLPGVG